MKKTISKSQVINYIKEHGTESLSDERVATINGVRVGNCGRTIILRDENYEFPSFTSVTLDDYELVFETKNSTVKYDNSARRDKIAGSYFKVIEGIMIGMGLIEEGGEELEANGLTVKTSKGYTLSQVIDENVDYGKEWVRMGWLNDMEFTNEKFYYFSNFYGSEGGFYDEEKDVIIPSYYIEDMDDEDFIEAYGMNKDEAEELEFIEEPIIRELQELQIVNENGRYGPLVIKDGDGRNYENGKGLYKCMYGLFYRVVLK